MPRRHDGDLLFPEYGVMYKSAQGGEVDILACGASKLLTGADNIPGLYHGCVSEQTAIDAEKAKLVPSGKDSDIVSEPLSRVVEVEGVVPGRPKTVCDAIAFACFYVSSSHLLLLLAFMSRAISCF